MAGQGDGPRLQVLLVEDRPDDVRAVAVACRDLSQPVDLTVASTVAEARAKLAAHAFDVVLLDGALAQLAGADAVEALAAADFAVPCVALTPSYDGDLAGELLGAGADDWLALEELTSRMLARVVGYAMERHQLALQASELAHVDELTGLLNDRGLRAALRQHLALAVRDARPLAVVVIDVDDMQSINDTLGWDTGDQVLETVGDLMRRTFRVSDVLARLHEDQFAVVLCGNGHLGVEAAIERLIATLEMYAEAHVLPYTLSVSVGWTVAQPDARLTVDAVLAAAQAHLVADPEGVEWSTGDDAAALPEPRPAAEDAAADAEVPRRSAAG